MTRLARTATCFAVTVLATLMGTSASATALPYSGSDLRLWLRADEGVIVDTVNFPGRVITWEDQIGVGGNTVAQDGTGTSGARPILVSNAINGLPAVRFDASTREIVGNAVLPGGDGARTIFVVGVSNSANNDVYFDPNGQGAGSTLFRITPEINVRFGNGNVGYGNSATGSPSIVVAQLPTGGTQDDTLLFKNGPTPLPGVASDPGTAVTTGTAGYLIGGASDLRGDIAEVLVFESVLSKADLQNVGFYLQTKYGISGSFTRVVPEPGTLTLAVFGIVGLSMTRRRRR